MQPAATDPSWRKKSLALRSNGCPAAAPGCEGRWQIEKWKDGRGGNLPHPQSGLTGRRAPPVALLPMLR